MTVPNSGEVVVMTVVAVIASTLDTQGRLNSVDEDEAIEIATDYLDEIGWFSDGPVEPDHVVRIEAS